MGRKRTRSAYVVVEAGLLSCVDEQKNLVLDSDPDKAFADELTCPTADQLLIALRKAFSLTYPTNIFVEGQSTAIMEIRRIGVEALIHMSDVLNDLGLPPIPRPIRERQSANCHTFQFFLIPERELHVTVKFEGRKQSLRNLVEVFPGDVLVRTLRGLVSDSFAEMHDDEQHEEVLQGMRAKLWSVLPAYNDVFRDMCIEPIAEFVADEESQNQS